MTDWLGDFSISRQDLLVAQLHISERDRLIGRYEEILRMTAQFVPKESPCLYKAIQKLVEDTAALYGDDASEG